MNQFKNLQGRSAALMKPKHNHKQDFANLQFYPYMQQLCPHCLLEIHVNCASECCGLK